MHIAAIIASALLALAMVFPALGKLRGNADLDKARDRLGVSPTLWKTIGGLELAGSAGLVAGIWWAPIGIAAAAGFVLLMIGAIIAHRRVGDPVKELNAPGTMLVLAVATLVLRILAT